jgi:hypothetical protein
MGDSMSTIINATTTNGVVIQPDNSGSLVLQTNNGNTALTIDTSQNITTTNKLSVASMPTGSVLQVVQGSSTVQNSTSSNSFTASSLTASITPKFSTSKILVIVNQNGIATGTAFTGMSLQLLRGATDLTLFATQTSYQTISLYTSAGTSYLDSPATTSATTYSTSQALTYGAGTVISQSANAVSTITLMEIAA